MKRFFFLVILCLVSFAPLHAACTSTGDIWWGGSHSYDYIVDANFSQNCPNWTYENASRSSQLTGLCNGYYSNTYVRFVAAGATNRVYQTVHIPGPSEPGYINSQHFTIGVHYEMSGAGTWTDNFYPYISDADTGAQIYVGTRIRGDATQPCFNPGWTFTADLAGKNIHVEIKGLVVTSGFKWKLTDVSFIQGP